MEQALRYIQRLNQTQQSGGKQTCVVNMGGTEASGGPEAGLGVCGKPGSGAEQVSLRSVKMPRCFQAGGGSWQKAAGSRMGRAPAKALGRPSGCIPPVLPQMRLQESPSCRMQSSSPACLTWSDFTELTPGPRGGCPCGRSESAPAALRSHCGRPRKVCR